MMDFLYEGIMYTNILLATDLSENHFHMCEQAVEIAKCFHAKLYLLHVIEPPASLQLAQGLGFAEFDHPVKDDARAVRAKQGIHHIAGHRKRHGF